MTKESFRPQHPIKITALIEGIELPVLSMQAQFAMDAPGVIQVVLPYVDELEPDRWEIKETVEGGTTEEGLEILYDADVDGLQPETKMDIFKEDLVTGENVWVQSATLNNISVSDTSGSKQLAVTGFTSMIYAQKCYKYMLDRGTALGISGSDWEGRLGVSSISDITGVLSEKGLTEGVVELLRKAGTETTKYLNLCWMLQRLEQRIQVVNNPKAQGYFNKTRMDTILDKTVGSTSGNHPISQIINYVLQLLRYAQVNVPFPSFLDATYNGSGSITPLRITNGNEVSINDWIILPDLEIAPPPRCNVLFACDYARYQDNIDFSKVPTRLIARLTGSGALSGNSDAETTLMLPDEFSDGIMEHGRYYNRPQEIYMGVNQVSRMIQAPEFAEEMGSEYMEGFYKAEYEKMQHYRTILLGSNTFNMKPVLGFPALALMKNGRHKIGLLTHMSLTYSPQGQAITTYGIGRARSYDKPIASNAGGYWYEHEFYSPEHIGSYLYPTLLGPSYESEEIKTTGEEEPVSDLSILAHLHSTEGQSDENIQELKADPYATRDAVDKLFAEYMSSASQVEYARKYGRRVPITKDQFLKDVMGCKYSDDGKIAVGGYSAVTNSISVPEGSEQEAGERISADTAISGCYYHEKQKALYPAFLRFKKLGTTPVSTDEYTPIATDDDIDREMAAMRQRMLRNLIAEGL